MRRTLRRRGFGAETIDEVVASLSRQNLLNDADFARTWVQQRSAGRRPMGPDRLAAELRGKQVSSDLARDAVAALDPEREVELARQLARARAGAYRNEPVAVARRKLSGVLRRRGFTWDAIRQALAGLLGEDDG